MCKLGSASPNDVYQPQKRTLSEDPSLKIEDLIMTERIERDSIGERSIPAQALYGINALRGSENFNLGGPAMSAYPYLLRSMAQIKKAAARAN